MSPRRALAPALAVALTLLVARTVRRGLQSRENLARQSGCPL